METNDIITYKKCSEIKQSTLKAFGFRDTFIEIYLENGDVVTDVEIIKIYNNEKYRKINQK